MILSEPTRTWDGLLSGGHWAIFHPKSKKFQELHDILWPLISSQSFPELPLRPRRVPPNQPGEQ